MLLIRTDYICSFPLTSLNASRLRTVGQRRSVKIKTGADLHSWEGNNCSLQDKHFQQLHVNTLLRQEYLDPLMYIKIWVFERRSPKT